MYRSFSTADIPLHKCAPVEEMLAYILGAPSIDDVMSYNSLTAIWISKYFKSFFQPIFTFYLFSLICNIQMYYSSCNAHLLSANFSFIHKTDILTLTTSLNNFCSTALNETIFVPQLWTSTCKPFTTNNHRLCLHPHPITATKTPDRVITVAGPDLRVPRLHHQPRHHEQTVRPRLSRPVMVSSARSAKTRSPTSTV